MLLGSARGFDELFVRSGQTQVEAGLISDPVATRAGGMSQSPPTGSLPLAQAPPPWGFVD